ncbi:MAG: sulfotransferase [Proteobacteria bacterium]|nr:sulfotransferase [Pseudomonadota bacterium]
MSSQPSEPTGSLATALAHTARLLAAEPSMAEEQAREILKVVPHHPEAQLLLATALRAQGKANEARDILVPLAAAQAKSSPVLFELGLAQSQLGESGDAVKALSKAVRLSPRLPGAWLALADEYTLLGDAEAADQAYARHIQASADDPRLLEAANALCEGKLAIAERMLRDYLKGQPTDVAAIRMLAEVGARLGRLEDAEKLLARCVELAPGFTTARHNYASILYRHNKPQEAIAQADKLLERDPRNPNYRSLKAAALGRIGEYGKAIECYESVLKGHPNQPKAWMSYGHVLKTVGRSDDGIAAYRKSIALMPHLGEAYWSLANLKTFQFTPAEIDSMRAQLVKTGLSENDRLHLHFSLGKSLEDGGHYAESFAHYEKGNELRRASAHYDARDITKQVSRAMALFTREFFISRQGSGCKAPDPIFIVGLTRSGSTLLEQILSSHSAVEGTMELPDIIAITRRMSGRKRKADVSAYPDVLEGLPGEQLRVLGEEYLAQTRVQRKLGKPFFIDKMPNNWMHVGLIHLILPNAKIVDARRHPLGCCFSNYKQHFARGQGFTYKLADLGRYYADYVELMAHFDTVLPGKVHRVFYENMIADPEGEVHKLLAYCGVPFEEQCLRFYENERAVRTASSEQVRQPIFTESMDQWRHYEPWLEELKTVLGPVLETYPEVPSF